MFLGKRRQVICKSFCTKRRSIVSMFAVVNFNCVMNWGKLYKCTKRNSLLCNIPAWYFCYLVLKLFRPRLSYNFVLFPFPICFWIEMINGKLSSWMYHLLCFAFRLQNRQLNWFNNELLSLSFLLLDRQYSNFYITISNNLMRSLASFRLQLCNFLFLYFLVAHDKCPLPPPLSHAHTDTHFLIVFSLSDTDFSASMHWN